MAAVHVSMDEILRRGTGSEALRARRRPAASWTEGNMSWKVNVSKSFMQAFGIGLGLVAVALGALLLMNRGSRVGLEGKVLKVRTAPLDDQNSVAVLDFRFHNPAQVPFWVRTVTVIMEDKDGKLYEGQTVSEVDAKRMFTAMPLLGQKYNPTLLMRDKIAPGESEDRMVAATFEAPEARIDGRKRFLIRIEDVDGPVSELSEN